MNVTFKLECENVVYGLVCLVNDNYMLQDGRSTTFYAGLTHHRYSTSKYSISIIRIYGHCHHIEGNYISVLKCVWINCHNLTRILWDDIVYFLYDANV